MNKSIQDHFIREVAFSKPVGLSLNEYPFSLPAVRHLDRLKLHPKVTFFVGENGTGKSTILEAIAVAYGLNPEGGSKHVQFATRSSHSNLHEHIRLIKNPRTPRDSYFLRAESAFNLASIVEFMPGYGNRSLHEQSHGESFYSIFMNRFGGGGLYLLDEPESPLSPMRQMGFLSILHDLLKLDSQFIIATHSPILMSYPDAWIYSFSEKGIKKITVEESEHFKVTKEFVNHPEKMLKVLMEEDRQ